jgi:hypothetical protein
MDEGKKGDGGDGGFDPALLMAYKCCFHFK